MAPRHTRYNRGGTASEKRSVGTVSDLSSGRADRREISPLLFLALAPVEGSLGSFQVAVCVVSLDEFRRVEVSSERRQW